MSLQLQASHAIRSTKKQMVEQNGLRRNRSSVTVKQVKIVCAIIFSKDAYKDVYGSHIMSLILWISYYGSHIMGSSKGFEIKKTLKVCKLKCEFWGCKGFKEKHFPRLEHARYHQRISANSISGQYQAANEF